MFILFSLFCSAAVISTILSSSSLIHSSASFILLLIPSSAFFISIIVLFNNVSSLYLLALCQNFLCLLILCLHSFSKIMDIFTIFSLNSFLGALPISTSFTCSSGVLSCFFIWNTFLCLLILSNFLHLWAMFCRLQCSSSSCFWCLPPVDETSLEACAGFLVGETGACPLVYGTGSCPSCG